MDSRKLTFPYRLADRIAESEFLGKVVHILDQYQDLVSIMEYEAYKCQGLLIYWNPKCLAVFTKEEWEDDSVGTYS